ncbi:MAG TPA: Rrf2 family transcriptional regulator [Ferruginibacter sp.]|nr:Rrf2 family transcriptional regulator [Ferruginibacter sp.]HRN79422.1 Rrf2 family transcriptional regulator [Ferruginibacter sp.]HRO17374.1 Rrf2 family transcriptional regulator [Ferruginibacter sp.]HRQ21091.1 Rrf2 family transcriptional regulator [Ferruginibacter sp.]
MFSKATEYALRAVIYIAQKGSPENKISIEEISGAIGSPRSFTAKILQILRKDNRIIQSVTGPQGGFYMTEQHRKLPVRAILTAMNEDHILSKCVLGLHTCNELKPCPMHASYKKIKEQLIQLFETRTIAQLAHEMDAGTAFIKFLGKKKEKRK